MLLPGKFQIYIRISHLLGEKCLGPGCLRKQSLSQGSYAGGLFGEAIPGNERGTGEEGEPTQRYTVKLVLAVGNV